MYNKYVCDVYVLHDFVTIRAIFFMKNMYISVHIYIEKNITFKQVWCIHTNQLIYTDKSTFTTVL